MSGSVYEEAISLNLSFYNSTESFTLRVYDYSNVFLLPAICVCGILAGFVNIFIIAKTGVAENIHLYMLIAAVSDTSFLLTQVFIAVVRCGTLCPYGYTYVAKAYEIYGYLYVGYTIVTFSALVDISVSIDRIRLFSSQSKIMTRTNFAVRCFVLFVIAALLTLPDYVLARQIVPMGVLVHYFGEDKVSYEMLYTKAMKPEWLQPAVQIPMTVFSLIKGPMLIVMVLVVDIVVVVKFKKHLEKKKQMTKASVSGKESKESREANRATTMIISVSLLYFMGNLIDNISDLMNIFGVDLYNGLPIWVVMDNVFLFGSHGLYIFIYYNFDKSYNKLFQRLILRRKVLARMPGTEATESSAPRKSTVALPITDVQTAPTNPGFTNL